VLGVNQVALGLQLMIGGISRPTPAAPSRLITKSPAPALQPPCAKGGPAFQIAGLRIPVM
jgi:hypothetical protein